MTPMERNSIFFNYYMHFCAEGVPLCCHSNTFKCCLPCSFPLLCTKQILLKLCLWWLISSSTLRLVAILETASPTVAGICPPSRERVPFPDWRLRPSELGRLAQKLGAEMKRRSPRSKGGGGAYLICSEFTRGGEERRIGRITLLM